LRKAEGMSAILSSILPSKPTAEEVATAAPLRAKVRDSVLKRYDIFEKELPTYYDAGLTYWQIRPMKNFLESEIAWWNANIELTVQQVNTRKTTYVEQLQPLNKDLTNNLKTALAALKPEKSQAILDKLSGNTTEAFTDAEVAKPAAEVTKAEKPSAEAKEATKAAKPTEAKEATKAEKAAIDLSGATASIDLSGIQKTVSASAEAAAKKEKPAKETSWGDDIASAFTIALQVVGIIFYICIALRIAGFVANDLLYKAVPYRALGFIYAFIFAPILLPYYLYREFAHWIWPTIQAPHFESLFPMNPYDPSEPIDFHKRIFGYADTPAMRSWIRTMQEQELGSRVEAASRVVHLSNYNPF